MARAASCCPVGLRRCKPCSRAANAAAGAHRRLAVNYAFHSAQMAPLAAEFGTIDSVTAHAAGVPFIRRSPAGRSGPEAGRRLLGAMCASLCGCRCRELDAG